MVNLSEHFARVISFVCLSPVLLPAAPQLRLSNLTVGPVYVAAGSNATAQTVNAFNVGDGALNLSASSSAPTWLSATVAGPSTCPGGPVSPCIPITVNFNTAGLA